MTTTLSRFSTPMFAKYTAIYFVIWLVLSGGAVLSPTALAFGIVAALMASYCTHSLLAKAVKDDSLSAHSSANKAEIEHSKVNSRLKLTACLRFVPFFLIQSLKGGWESALLALNPRSSIHSGFITYPMNLPHTKAKLLFINCVSLLPGTVSCNYQKDDLQVHVLDINANNCAALHKCEQKIAALFSHKITDKTFKP